MAKFKVEVDKNKCIGCGMCVSICPDNFVLQSGKAKPKKAEVNDLGCNSEAERSCPVGAIKVTKLK